MNEVTDRPDQLYRVWHRCADACQDPGDPYGRSPDHQCYTLLYYAITKITAKRIYFRDGYDRRYFLARSELEDDGDGRGPHVYHRQLGDTLYLTEPTWHRRQKRAAPDLSELRKQMADAHPDRGGDRDTFTAARTRYMAARSRGGAA